MPDLKFAVKIRDFDPGMDNVEKNLAVEIENAIKRVLDRSESDGIVIVTRIKETGE